MSEYNPLSVLEAVVDEVDGLRRTDPRSFLPRWLLQQAREAIAPTDPGTPGASAALRDVNDLQGRTIAHVFDVGVKRGDLVLLCTDGTFIALEATGDDEDNDVGVVHHYHGTHPASIEQYVEATWLASAGAISGAEAERIKQEEHERKVQAARNSVERAKAHLKREKAELAKLNPTVESPA